MIEKIIDWYLHDEESWNIYGDRLELENFEKVKPLLNNGFVKKFIKYHGFHDWVFESFQTDFIKNSLNIIIRLNNHSKKRVEIHFDQCISFRVETDNAENYPLPVQVQIISFEKANDVCVGIALTTGLVIYIYCKSPIVYLKKRSS